MAMMVSNAVLRCRVSPPIRQALATDLTENRAGALMVGHAEGFTGVVAEVKLAA